MPVRTVEQLGEKAAALRKRLAETAGSLEGPEVRALKKKIRRLQRRRRRLLAETKPASGEGEQKKAKEVEQKVEKEVETKVEKEKKEKEKEKEET